MNTTSYTDPDTIDVDTVVGNITHGFQVRGHLWDEEPVWPNVTVLALANEIVRLRRRPWHRFLRTRPSPK